MGVDIEWHSATVHGTGTEPFAASSLARVGHVVARVLAHWETVKNQYVYAAGTVTSANDVLKAAEKVIGHEFAVGDHDVEECIQEARKRVDKGYPIRVYFCSNGAYCTMSSWAPWHLFRHAMRMSCCPLRQSQ